ncbi:S-adenosyl-L-methionine-dependent methyltransferase [Pyronema domesticum]|nr:S-adenosyl-L-methionine-dependent methyltransferase [Pyronema domesticum]
MFRLPIRCLGRQTPRIVPRVIQRLPVWRFNSTTASSTPSAQQSTQQQPAQQPAQKAESTPPSEEPKPKPQRTYSTPLAKFLTEAIKTTGPIPLAQFMRQCLTSDIGYYTSESDPFGRKGDFITSPEISQLFGEMLGIWIVSEWMAQGRKDKIQLIELGPGRGTLMDDVLRTLSQFRPLASAITSVHLVEASETLRVTQAQLLCNSTTFTENADGSLSCISKYNGIPITWHPLLSKVPKCSSPFFLAHEFFDALPIHAFEATKNGWRELLVSPDDSATAENNKPEFILSRADKSTPHSMMLPELSERYKRLSKVEGSIIEISPESLTITEEIAKRIGGPKAGGALFVDYGPLDTIPINSLRGIRHHEMVSPFANAGEVDVSADVDFFALAERALDASEGVEVHGPVEQGAFLLTMGMRERMEQLARGVEEEKKKEMETGVQRLTERGGGAMGKVYKVLSIVPERGGQRPVGFGGGLMG